MKKYSKKNIQNAEEKEKQGLTPEEKKILEETMRRHDKALRMLANM